MMNRYFLAIFSLLLFTGPLWGDEGTTGPALIRDPEPFTEEQLIGEWREHWGIPGDTDVTYNDRYRISRGENNKIVVAITSREQRISDVSVRNGVLHFTQRTDAFEVRYRLILPGKERWMIGSATTPKGSYPIIWSRVAGPP